MKSLLLLGLVGLSATAFGQSCIVKLRNDYNGTTLRTFRGYDCVENMKECSKTIRFGYGQDPHRSYLRCERIEVGQPNPNPYPPTNPNPYPPTYGVTVSGLVEDQPFFFTARDASELYVNCLADIRRIVYGSADDIFFTANNARFVSASTAGWYNDTQICSILEQEARRTYGQNYTSPMRVVGSLERAPFQIEAMDRAELLNNCIATFTATQQGSVDEITYSLNGAPFQRITTSGWWNSPARACKAMLNSLDSQIR